MYWRLLDFRLLLPLALLAPGASGWAQAVKPQPQPQAQERSSSRQDSRDQRQALELKGKILQEKEVSVSDSDTKDFIVLMELDDGQRIAVDLGPRTALKDADVKVGAEARVHGGLIDVEGSPVFLATEIDLGERTYQINHPLITELSQPGQQNAQTGQQRSYQLSGTVEDEQNVDVRGGGQNKVVLLRTDKGERAMVDLGPLNNLQNLSVTKGSRISVSGFHAQFGDHGVLFANQVQAGGQTVNVERNFPRQGGQDQSPASSAPGQK